MIFVGLDELDKAHAHFVIIRLINKFVFKTFIILCRYKLQILLPYQVSWVKEFTLVESKSNFNTLHGENVENVN